MMISHNNTMYFIWNGPGITNDNHSLNIYLTELIIIFQHECIFVAKENVLEENSGPSIRK